jgi:curved DNA-binding protein CbpA
MTKMEAYAILKITEKEEEVSVEVIKKKYREEALRWHPDKNHTPNATEEFQKINTAYHILLKAKSKGEYEGFEIESYRTMLFAFLRENLPEGVDVDNLIYVLEIIMKKVKQICEKNAMVIFEKMNIELLSGIYSVLLSYREIFYLSDGFIDGLCEVLDKKKVKEKEKENENGNEKGENVIVHPTIDDLFDNNLYKIVRGGHTFLVPLWHDELIYDISGSDLCVKCIPILPDEIRIDENNHIEIDITWKISEIWEKTNLFIYIGRNTFYILREQLILAEYQTVRLYEVGISKINTRDIYDISKKGNIIIHVHLVI